MNQEITNMFYTCCSPRSFSFLESTIPNK